MSFDYDLFVIGAGSGGTRAARIAAHHGAKVAVAESFRIGGTCVIRGCVPKKILVYASRFADSFAQAPSFGWTLSPPRFDWPTLVAAKEKEIRRLSALYEENLQQSGVTIFAQHARVDDPHRIVLANGQAMSTRHILIATGGRPERPASIAGIEHTITSDEIFDLPRFPRRLLIIGAGYVALEFACLFQRLGAQVHVALRGAHILRGFDEDIRDHLRDAMQREGVRFHFECLPQTIQRSGDNKQVTMCNGERLEFDEILTATGRCPNTQGLGLEAAGVRLRDDGAVIVDDGQTSSVSSIYAVGDVNGGVALTPVAIREGHWLADRLFAKSVRKVDYSALATAVFTTPEIGTVGLSEAAACARYPVVDIYKTAFRPLQAQLSRGETRTFMKLVVEGETDRVLGAHILGYDAAEIVQTLAIAVKMGVTKADLDATFPVHPTAAEELLTLRTATRISNAV